MTITAEELARDKANADMGRIGRNAFADLAQVRWPLYIAEVERLQAENREMRAAIDNNYGPHGTILNAKLCEKDAEIARLKEMLDPARRVLDLVDGYISHQNPDKLLAHDGGFMTWGELRAHCQAAVKLIVGAEA